MARNGSQSTKTTRDKAAELVDTVLKAFREIVENQEAPASARVAAGKEILDRAEGRPRQTVEATVTDETAKKYDSIANQLRLELLGADE